MIYALIDHLAMYYQAGNLPQMVAYARNILSAIPEDIVALQFLGLALYQMGRHDDARRTFQQVAAKLEQPERRDDTPLCEPAHHAMFRAATRAHSGLADGWYRIGQLMTKFGLHQPATQAFAAALAASGLTAGTHRRSTDALPDLALEHPTRCP
jgi:tetratricopeptide (TPR) repeat protein